MSFKNLLLVSKEVEVQGVHLTLKKWSLGFSMRNSIVRASLFDNPTAAPSLDAIVDYLGAQVFEGVVSWDIKHEDGLPYALTLENCKAVVSLYTDFHLELFKAISEFNNSIPATSKKK